MENKREQNLAILDFAKLVKGKLKQFDEEAALQIIEQAIMQVQFLKNTPFIDGRVIYRSNDEIYSLVCSPTGNGGYDVATLSTKDLLRIEAEANQLMRENKKVCQKPINAVSGTLPKLGKKVSTLFYMAEGELLNSLSLTNPVYEGGEIYVLALEGGNMPFSIDNTVIENAPIPDCLFLIRTEKTTQGYDENISTKNIRVTHVFATCVKSVAIVDDNTPVFKWGFGNAATDNYGWMCLGNNFASGALVYPDASSLAKIPIDIISYCPTTGHYGIMLKDINSLYELIKFLKENAGKTFPIEKLIPCNLNFNEWIHSCIKYIQKVK